MLTRLEIERGTSNARALAAQEAERHRIAQELHDEVGQSLTAVLLGLKRPPTAAPEECCDELSRCRRPRAPGLDEVRRIARRLRPGVLEDLGLHNALASLATESHRARGCTFARVSPRPAAGWPGDRAGGLPRRPGGLTNVARHAGALRRARRCAAGHVLVLRVADNGRGGAEPRGRGHPRDAGAGAADRWAARGRATAQAAAQRSGCSSPRRRSSRDSGSCSPTTTRWFARACGYILDTEPDLTVVAEAGDGAEAVELRPHHAGRPGGARHRDAADDRAAGRSRDLPARAPDLRDPDAVDARQRAVLLRGAQSGGLAATS